MKANDIIAAAFAIIALIILWVFIDEREKGKRKDEIIEKLIKENEQLKISYLSLFQKYLQAIGNIEINLINELEQLKENIDKLDTPTHLELESVIKRLSDNEGPKAVKDLAKIVENKLKVKVENDKSFKKNKTLNNLLDYALECKWISESMHTYGKLLKDIRNKESHELAVHVPIREIGIAVFGGVEIIYKLNT